jgi:hypothetical protein
MKAICVATSGRIERFKAFFCSLSANKIAGWNLFVSLEPGENCDQLYEWLTDFAWRVIPISYNRNSRRLGPDLNTFMAHWMAIEDGADALVYFDDDMVLSPDAIELCDWYINQTAYHDPQRYAGLCLCNDASDPSIPNSITDRETWRGLVGQGYCYMRPMWNTFVKRNWFRYEPHFGGDSYDWALGHSALDQNKIILRPRLSRTQHTGIQGFHGGKIFPEHISNQSNTIFNLENE